MSGSAPVPVGRTRFALQLLRALVAGVVAAPISMVIIDRFSTLLLAMSVVGAVFLFVWAQKQPFATCIVAMLVGAVGSLINNHLRRHPFEAADYTLLPAVGVGVLLPAFAIGFLAALSFHRTGRRRWWWWARTAGLLCIAVLSIGRLNREPILAAAEQLGRKFQQWKDDRALASARRQLWELPPINRVEIRFRDSNAAPWALQKTLTGSDAEALAALWRQVDIRFGGRGAWFGPLRYGLRLFHDGQLAQELETDYTSFRLAGGRSQGCTFSIVCHGPDDFLKAGEFTPVNGVRAMAAWFAGFDAWQHGDTSRAMEMFRRAAALEPKDPFYQRALGSFYSKVKNYEQAADAFSKAIALNGGDAWLIVARAQCFDALGRTQATIAECDTALRMDAYNASALYLRGTACFRNGAYQRAVADFDKALSYGLSEDEDARARDLRSRALSMAPQPAPPGKAGAAATTTSSSGAAGS